ncbi:MAG: hypothetical protein QX198_14915 [Methylococcaceae bacterium]
MSDLGQTLRGFVNTHRENGIFLDTNVLLLFIFALYQPEKIGLKRLSKYVKEDGDLLIQYVDQFRRILTTPHVLAETSNLARQISKGKHSKVLADSLYPLFCHNTQGSFVKVPINDILVNAGLFGKLGLTDACIATLAQEKQLLLTDDLDLYIAACSNGGDVINFTHMREAAGII